MEMLNTIASDVNLNTLVKLLYHSIEATFLDALGVMPQRMSFNRNSIIEQCRAKVLKNICSINVFFSFQQLCKNMVLFVKMFYLILDVMISL